MQAPRGACIASRLFQSNVRPSMTLCTFPLTILLQGFPFLIVLLVHPCNIPASMTAFSLLNGLQILHISLAETTGRSQGLPVGILRSIVSLFHEYHFKDVLEFTIVQPHQPRNRSQVIVPMTAGHPKENPHINQGIPNLFLSSCPIYG